MRNDREKQRNAFSSSGWPYFLNFFVVVVISYQSTVTFLMVVITWSYSWNKKEKSLLLSWVWVSCSPYFTFYSELTACRSWEKAIHPFFPTFISPPQSYFFNSVSWLLCFCQVHPPSLCMSYAFQMFFSCS